MPFKTENVPVSVEQVQGKTGGGGYGDGRGGAKSSTLHSSTACESIARKGM